MTEMQNAYSLVSGASAEVATTADVQKVLEAMQNMAKLLRATNARMQELEAQVRRLEKVTPAQAKALNAAVRTRAAEVCKMHRAAGCESAAAAAIRKAVRQTCGITGMRELPRCDYAVAERQIQMWDDYGMMRKIKAKAAKT